MTTTSSTTIASTSSTMILEDDCPIEVLIMILNFLIDDDRSIFQFALCSKKIHHRIMKQITDNDDLWKNLIKYRYSYNSDEWDDSTDLHRLFTINSDDDSIGDGDDDEVQQHQNNDEDNNDNDRTIGAVAENTATTTNETDPTTTRTTMSYKRIYFQRRQIDTLVIEKLNEMTRDLQRILDLLDDDNGDDNNR